MKDCLNQSVPIGALLLTFAGCAGWGSPSQSAIARAREAGTQLLIRPSTGINESCTSYQHGEAVKALARAAMERLGVSTAGGAFDLEFTVRLVNCNGALAEIVVALWRDRSVLAQRNAKFSVRGVSGERQTIDSLVVQLLSSPEVEDYLSERNQQIAFSNNYVRRRTAEDPSPGEGKLKGSGASVWEAGSAKGHSGAGALELAQPVQLLLWSMRPYREESDRSKREALRFQDKLVASLHGVRNLMTSTPEDVNSMLGVERARQASGCDDERCLAELAGALGARFVVYGRVGSTSGDEQSVSLTVLDLKSGSVVGRIDKTWDRFELVLGSVGGIVEELLEFLRTTLD